ncbi:MAG TPA: hypothetical protein VFC19_41940 [Candidatus Limnocylindrales bacterium]|nr:hypothetical protein [Candidatus Limnocylindrales bacterium]
MILLGFLLILASAGLSLALIWSNDSVFNTPMPAIDLFGNQIHATLGQGFLAGVVAGAAALLGLAMIISAIRRNVDRRSTARHQLRNRRDEIQDQQQKHDATNLAAHRAAKGEAADSEGITTRR